MQSRIPRCKKIKRQIIEASLIQTTLDGAAHKWFSVLPIDIKSDWKRFTQEFSKMFDSERNKQHQRVLCNEIRILTNETKKKISNTNRNTSHLIHMIIKTQT